MSSSARFQQQRRLKQAMQFYHKDSADLLPLDSLKKLEAQPQDVVQKRVLERQLLKSLSASQDNSHCQSTSVACSHISDPGLSPGSIQGGVSTQNTREEEQATV
uniref:nuclear receptor-interacting protein 3-like n=1 Tax=Myxine glutinosa TaxID=7769 RepID=UPI00358EAC06